MQICTSKSEAPDIYIAKSFIESLFGKPCRELNLYKWGYDEQTAILYGGL